MKVAMKKFIPLLIASAVCFSPSTGQADERVTVGGFGGAHIFSKNLELGAFDSSDSDSPRNSASFGIRAGYALLDLVTFFTGGPTQARAWTVRRGARAPEAAGVIHTDFEKGFIRAETIAYDDYVACGGEAGAREAGKLRLEGKNYVVQDGDLLHVRFNV